MNKFKYKTSFKGNVEAYARLPTCKIEELRKLLEDGVIPHKDKLYSPAMAFGSVVFWSYKGVSPKTNKQVEIVGCIDTIINEVSIEYLDVKGDDVFKRFRKNPKSVTTIVENRTFRTSGPSPVEIEDDDIPF